MVSWVGWWSTTFRGSIGVSAAHGGDCEYELLGEYIGSYFFLEK